MPEAVTVKTEVQTIDGTPDKRVFWSIVADYGLRTGICELIDNAIDLWTLNGKKRNLSIRVELDLERQIVIVEDNAGGITHRDLRLLIAPGGSRSDPSASIIGVFGVGSKRASVAIGEHVEIRTRHKSDSTYQLDVTKDWLESPDWNLPVYQIPDISPNTTRVEISKLRRPFSDEDVKGLRAHLAETYSWFIINGCIIKINGIPLDPITFDTFAFPKKYPPRRTEFTVNVIGLGTVSIRIEAGLIRDRDPETSNYGVYVYCNNRLVIKEWQTRDVGYFISGEAGVPHPDASLSRVIVWLEGPARAMPWNSSKSAIDSDHFLFHQIRSTIVQLNGYYSSLSRRLKNDWDGQVFGHAAGEFEDVPPTAQGKPPKVVLPPLPRVNKTRTEHLKDRNKTILKNQPWTLGLVEAMAAADIVLNQRFDTKNRIALILLDSNFEIALKEFIVHRTDLFPPRLFTDTHIATLFKNRGSVVRAVKTAVPALPQTEIDKANHFYMMRNKIIHERASTTVTDSDVESYRKTIQAVLKILFKLRW